MTVQQEFERAFLDGELDPFDFSLAEKTGWTLRYIREDMPNNEYLQWRALHVWRKAQQSLKGG